MSLRRKRHFIVNRRTLFLRQFEFSTACAFGDSLERLRSLENDLKVEFERKPNRRRQNEKQPSLSITTSDDSAGFELFWEEVLITGTIQMVTDEKTLFIGLSNLAASRFSIQIVELVLFFVQGLGVALYLVGNNSAGARLLLFFCTLPSICMFIVFAGIRLRVEQSVNRLIDTFRDDQHS